MLKKNYFIKQLVQGVRFCSVSVKSKQDTLLIQRTTYQTDDWTNITRRFTAFIGTNLHRKRNHPLKLTQDEVISFFQKWYTKNIDSSQNVPIYDKFDPVEENSSQTKRPDVFYISQELMLRSHFQNREINLLKSGADNFIATMDLYRRCQMDPTHFPVFHRIHFIRTHNFEEISRPGNRDGTSTQHLKEEQQTLLIEMAQHLIGTDVQYRFTEAKLLTNEPSWMFEIFHQNKWHGISGGGIIRNEIFEKSERPNSTGWDIAVGLDRLAMILYSIFDIRLLWNADPKFLSQFEPKKVKKTVPPVIKSVDEDKMSSPVEKTMSERLIERPSMQSEHTFAPKKTRTEMRITFALPSGEEIDSFPLDDLCNFIQKNTGGSALEVKIHSI